MVYIYPAVFEYDAEEKSFFVKFPDLKGCFTGGWSLKEAYEMAEDVLNLWLWDIEYEGQIPPEPSRIEELQPPESGFLSYIRADTEAYTPIMIKENPGMNIDPSRIKKEPRSA